MSLPARLLIVLAVLVGASLFLFALQSDDLPVADPASTTTEEPRPETGGVEPDFTRFAPAKPGVLDDPESCRKCHAEIYAEWESDRHSQAWVGELFIELSKDHRDPNCFSCHAPRPVFETGLDSPAEARENRRESGINCLTCHVNKARTHVVGPIADPKGTAEYPPDCGPAYDPRYPAKGLQEATIRFCGVCHNLHGTHKEFLGSRYAREGQTCLTCHMEEVEGSLVPGGPKRRRRVHRMPGGHSKAMLQKAMNIEARLEDGTIVARVINKGAGHRIPTDARHRAIYLRAQFYDKFNQPVAAAGPLDKRKELDATLDLIRLFYRHEQREPTQIDPAGTLGVNNWRESRIEVPSAAAGGRVVLRLYYLLRHDWPMEKGTLVDERELSLD